VSSRKKLPDTEKLVVMGRIAAPFGVKGWVKVLPDTEVPGSLLAYKTWWIGDNGDWRESAVAEAKVQGAILAARLEGCADRDAAAALRGKRVAVPRSQLPRAKSGEYYWVDLVGLKVVNVQSQELGRIEQILQTGANDVLVVQGERERLIPFLADVIREVDTTAGVVRVEWDADY
jgi:16S rRNA processing protein RimM